MKPLHHGNKREEDLDADPSETADLGGILLSPIFYLINFVADAITSNMGRIMTGDGLDLISGTEVLVAFKDSNGDNIHDSDDYNTVSAYEYPTISLSSFMPNFLGILSGTSYQVPNITYTPEEIFAGKIDLLSIDFISGKVPQKDTNGSIMKDANGNIIYTENSDDGWQNIRSTISQWYNVLRMVAIIGLLSVLIYTGIKIIISANAKDKAKYKEWIINWFMAVAILFAMHFIMAFIIAITQSFSSLISNACQSIKVNLSDGKSFYTNLMGLVRFMIQSEDFYKKVGYEVMYIALLVYTIKFTIIYLKRVLNMAFLTLIAPIVALTYPIDKINDGKAQGFDMWLKEYMFNAILQPMHQLMYYILVGSAVSIAASNPIYGIVVLMFMTEAEKLLKRIFGFDKAGGGTVGGMAGAFAAGAIASNIKNIAKMVGGKGSGGKSNVDSENELMSNVKPRKDNTLNVFSNNMLNSGDTPVEETPQQERGSDNLETEKESNPVRSRLETEEQESTEKPVANSDSTSSDSTSPDVTSSEAEESEQEDPSFPGFDGEEQTSPEEEKENAGKEGIRDKAKRIYNERLDKLSPEGRARLRGLGNVGKKIAKPIHDFDRQGTGYNTERWKRRGVKALKGAGKMALGATLGTAAAAVQAGISITDGKYNPLEGAATFAAGYAGGGKVAKSIGNAWSGVSNAYQEGYYEDNNDKLQEKLRAKQQKEFMMNDDNFKAYKNKYGTAEKAREMMKLAHDNMVPWGVNKPKEQFEVQRMANHIIERNQEAYDKMDKPQQEAYMEKAIEQSRNTKGFIAQLDSQGLKGIIRDPDKQKQYADAEIKSRGLDPKSKEAQQIRKSLDNAFRSAAVWYEVNK